MPEETMKEGVGETPVPNREQKSSMVELSDKNAQACLCPTCPTYNSQNCPAENKEKVFCSIGMTECGELDQVGCLCGNCPVFVENDLKVGYFCVKGEAMETGEPVSPESAD